MRLPLWVVFLHNSILVTTTLWPSLLGAMSCPLIPSAFFFRGLILLQKDFRFNVLVSDAITVSMVLQHIKDLDNTQGFVLDGFPRTIAQAQALDRELQSIGRQLDLAIYLNVPREELLFRLVGRFLCHAHQHVYNMYSRPPRVAGICDSDGSKLY
jgi:hypothetical protein